MQPVDAMDAADGAMQVSIGSMLSPRVSPIWSRLYNSPKRKGGVQVVLFRRTAGASGADGSYARRADSRWADHARCAAPDRPRRPSPPAVRTCVGLLARLRTHFLAVTGTGTRPAPKARGQPQTAAAVRRPDRVCPRRSSACGVFLVPTVRAHARLSTYALRRGAPYSEACHR